MIINVLIVAEPWDIRDCVEIAGRKKLAENPYVLVKNPVPPFYETESDSVNTIGGFAS